MSKATIAPIVILDVTLGYSIRTGEAKDRTYHLVNANGTHVLGTTDRLHKVGVAFLTVLADQVEGSVLENDEWITLVQGAMTASTVTDEQLLEVESFANGFEG